MTLDKKQCKIMKCDFFMISHIFKEFHYKSDIEYYIREYGNRDISKEIIRIKHLERYVDSLLR